ncbi:MAG: hypothetical protein CM1200mP41_09110 [Gammaproteobacteria bacterium]|nr:MAG: hypothetical protein CM1200mP41_09110 [Gammaproteobacteria bacterium]
MAVTSSLNINFLAKAIPGDLIADAELIKLGKRLAVGSVEFTSQVSRTRSPMQRVPTLFLRGVDSV